MEPKVTLIVEEVDASSEKSTGSVEVETFIENYIGYLYTVQKKDPSKKDPRILGPEDFRECISECGHFPLHVMMHDIRKVARTCYDKKLKMIMNTKTPISVKQ